MASFPRSAPPERGGAAGCGVEPGQRWRVSTPVRFFRWAKAEISSAWTGMPCGCLKAEAKLRYGHTNTEQTIRRSNYREEKSSHLTEQKFIFLPAGLEWKAERQRKQENAALG